MSPTISGQQRRPASPSTGSNPSPPPSSTKAASKQNLDLWEDKDSIVPLDLAKSISLENVKKLQTPAEETVKGAAPLASNSLDELNLEDEDDEEIKSLLSSPTSSPSASRPSSPSPVPSLPKAPSPPTVVASISPPNHSGSPSGTPSAGTPSGCIRPITPAAPSTAPKRGATAPYHVGLVALPRPASLPHLPEQITQSRREELQAERDSSLPPLVRARVISNNAAKRRSMS